MPEVSPPALAPSQEVHSPSAFHRLIADARTPLFSNAIALIVNTAGTGATGVVYWILAARLYEPAHVGRGSAMIAAMLLLAGLGELNLVGALIRFIPRAGAETGRLITAAYRASAITGLLAAGAFGFGWSQLMEPDRVLHLSLPLALWFAVAVVSMSIFALQDGVLTGLRQAKWVPLENALFGVVKIGLLIVLALWSVDVGVFLSWSIPIALTIAPVTCSSSAGFCRGTSQRLRHEASLSSEPRSDGSWPATSRVNSARRPGTPFRS
jgi:hypothetical protein